MSQSRQCYGRAARRGPHDQEVRVFGQVRRGGTSQDTDPGEAVDWPGVPLPARGAVLPARPGRGMRVRHATFRWVAVALARTIVTARRCEARADAPTREVIMRACVGAAVAEARRGHQGRADGPRVPTPQRLRCRVRCVAAHACRLGERRTHPLHGCDAAGRRVGVRLGARLRGADPAGTAADAHGRRGFAAHHRPVGHHEPSHQESSQDDRRGHRAPRLRGQR